MRYAYLGDRATAPDLRGLPCDPVLDARGRCIRGRGSQLVVDAAGRRLVVIARKLRVAADTWPPGRMGR